MTTPIDPRALRMFLAICRAGSISGAARRLAISQPSVSNAIARLEAKLGACLFERGRAGILLSAEGRALLRHAEAMEHLLANAAEEVAAAGRGIAGPLRVGGTPGALVSLLPPAVERLKREFSRFALHVIERPDSMLNAMLLRGEIDLAFVTTAIEAPPAGIDEITLARDPFALIVGPANAHLPGELALTDGGALSWVLPEAVGAFRRQVTALFIAAGVAEPADAIRCDSLLTTKAIVRDSDRVTILPRQVASAELSMGVLRAIAIREARFERSVGVRRLTAAALSPLGRALLAAMGHDP
ncbi:MAG: LysR family transcriptional regulator [Sphingomonadales bacterium]|nr:LysR family transcriptional regulator [Sphingomonadales bacterium]